MTDLPPVPRGDRQRLAALALFLLALGLAFWLASRWLGAIQASTGFYGVPMRRLRPWLAPFGSLASALEIAVAVTALAVVAIADRNRGRLFSNWFVGIFALAVLAPLLPPLRLWLVGNSPAAVLFPPGCAAEREAWVEALQSSGLGKANGLLVGCESEGSIAEWWDPKTGTVLSAGAPEAQCSPDPAARCERLRVLERRFATSVASWTSGAGQRPHAWQGRLEYRNGKPTIEGPRRRPVPGELSAE